ncbi:MAG: hypothetical protein GX452_14040 [Ignavibacteriales bacterium]|nr:hypothetical protein [Ignavibacteriales bacterium]
MIKLINKMMLKRLFFIVFCIMIVKVYGQNETVIHYTIEDGLQSNLVKAIYKDDVGYMWIGSDAGVVRFDGMNFVDLNEHLPSIYVKGFVRKSAQVFYILTDGGIVEVSIHGIKYKFKEVKTSERFIYPKQGFTDSKGRVWISGSRSICLIDEGGVKEFNVGGEYVSDNFLRSFQIFEGREGNIYAITTRGVLLKFDGESKSFGYMKELEIGAGKRVDAILYESKTKSYYIAGSDGVFQIAENGEDISTRQILAHKTISSIAFREQEGYVGTYDKGLFVFALAKSLSEEKVFQFSNVPIAGGGASVKALFLDDDKSVWLGTDEGIYLIVRHFFNHIDVKKKYPDSEVTFIKQLQAIEDRVYFSDSYNLYTADYRSQNPEIERYRVNSSSPVNTFAAGEKALWVSFENSELHKIDVLTKETIFKTKISGGWISAAFTDKEGRFYGFQEDSQKLIFIDDKLRETEYRINGKRDVRIQSIKSNNKGEIILAGKSAESVLFRLDRDKGQIESVTIKGDKEILNKITVYDLVCEADGSLSLATSSGVYILSAENKLEAYRVPDDFPLKSFRSIIRDSKGDLWLGSDAGLYLISGSNYVFFKKESGLPNATVVEGGIAETKSGFLLVATPGGIAELNLRVKKITPTTKPIITSFSDNNQKKEINDEFIIDSDIFFTHIALHYPAKEMKYRYRIQNYDTVWTEYYTDSWRVLRSLPAGDYMLEIQAIYPGHFRSEVTAFPFAVKMHWYSTIYAWIVYIIIIIIIIMVIVIVMGNYRVKKTQERARLLKLIVDRRTGELKKEKEKTESLLARTKELLEQTERARNDLEKANAEKNRVIRVATHDLKNPLSSVMSVSDILYSEEEDEEKKELLGLMKSASKYMLDLIVAMLEGAALEDKGTKLNLLRFNLSDLVANISRSFNQKGEEKRQKLGTEIEKGVYVEGDEFWITSAVNNLISNAIKYTPKGGEIMISVMQEGGFGIIKIKDTGPGFTDEDKKKIFGKFQKLSARPTGDEPSSGLGLSIVKEIIDKHNGEIVLNSKAGEGSEFIVKLHQQFRDEG